MGNAMFSWPDEIRDPAQVAPGQVHLEPGEIDEAMTLVEVMARDGVDGPEFTDHYTQALREVVEAKQEHRRLSQAPHPAALSGQLVDSMAALQQSVGKARVVRSKDGADVPRPAEGRTEDNGPEDREEVACPEDFPEEVAAERVGLPGPAPAGVTPRGTTWAVITTARLRSSKSTAETTSRVLICDSKFIVSSRSFSRPMTSMPTTATAATSPVMRVEANDAASAGATISSDSPIGNLVVGVSTSVNTMTTIRPSDPGHRPLWARPAVHPPGTSTAPCCWAG
ncbi:hypothetical protein [Streptomyces sp. NPDC058451]|uniref:hypothetical protein n=1 Tax=Streptomyces sp. NPDC058451 TaxID=3346506 RepID=UPI00365382E3